MIQKWSPLLWLCHCSLLPWYIIGTFYYGYAIAPFTMIKNWSCSLWLFHRSLLPWYRIGLFYHGYVIASIYHDTELVPFTMVMSLLPFIMIQNWSLLLWLSHCPLFNLILNWSLLLCVIHFSLWHLLWHFYCHTPLTTFIMIQKWSPLPWFFCAMPQE